MKTELAADLTVIRFAVFAEMAWLDRRPELAAICRLARDAGGRISAEVIEQALPGVTGAGVANLIRWCADLRLTDDWGSLTELGEQAADTSQAPVPEQGVYNLWTTSHPLLGARILHADRTTIYPDRSVRDIGPLPLDPEHDVPFTSVVRPEQRFVLRSFPSASDGVGARLQPTQAQCQLRWLLDWNSELSEVSITGFLDVRGKQLPVRHEPEHREVDLWRVVDRWAAGPLRGHGAWSAQDRRLMVGPARLTPDEQDSFRTNLDLGLVEIDGFGQWDRVRLADVPIGPDGAAGAQDWAMARFDRALQGDETAYTGAAVRRLFADLTEDTPLETFQPVLPGHYALLAGYADRPSVFWRLAAPVDLAPALPSEAELEPLMVGVRAPDERPERPGRPGGVAQAVRVPYGCRWSMQVLVGRLLGPDPARRFLLVDRFVRGVHNLISLEMLAAALAESGQPDFQVWTGNEVDDETLAEIADITGTRPQRYRDSFGSSGLPHDRYAVVVPRTGPPYGWQLSNSPLDARVRDGADASPQTPLRWRDLTAIRLSAEQLRPPMADWARGRPR